MTGKIPRDGKMKEETGAGKVTGEAKPGDVIEDTRLEGAWVVAPNPVGTKTARVGIYSRTTNVAIHAESTADVALVAVGGRLAGLFKGDVEVTGDIRLPSADCAEEFNVAGAPAEPGTVMVLGRDAALEPSRVEYDKRVAGVVSGAGSYRPAIVLDSSPMVGSRQPIALLGKVYCLVDARIQPIAIGDLLTTSSTPGHAMKATDHARSFGATIGKALAALDGGLGTIPILIALQ
jgi:hypothetical protein